MVAKVSPRQASEVQAPRDGKIKEIYAWPGDVVGDGTPLLRMDDSELQEKRKRLDAQRSEYTGHLRRIERLVEKDLVKDDVWDKNLQKLAQVRAELAVVEEQIERSVIRAPERGTVIWSDLKAGQEIQGAEPLYWIGDGEQLWLSTYIEEELTTGLAEKDIVAIFLDETSSPVLGEIDFISFGGPKGGNVNLYINAPRVGEIALKAQHNILVPIPSEEPHVIIPETALTEDGYIYLLAPISQAEPDKYMTSRFRPVIKKRENGVAYISNLGANAVVLLEPSADVSHRQLLTAFKAEEGWSDLYATAILKIENTQVPCGQDADGQSTGGCGGGCGGGAGVAASTDTDDPEAKVCLVPSDIFEIPELALTEEQKVKLPPIESAMPDAVGTDLQNLPMTNPSVN